MGSKTPTIIDLNAEAAKLTMFHGRTPQTTFAERQGSAARLASYRDGMLLLGKSVGTGHWETHPEDELIHVLDGATTLDIVEKDGPRSHALGAGMMTVVPAGAWHRFHSAAGATTMSAVIPGDHIDLDVDDPRAVEPRKVRPGGTPGIIDLAAELTKLTMFRRTPEATAADRKGSVAQLAPYRDGLLLAIKASGKDHWERHLTGDELIHVLDGAATLEIVHDDGPPRSFALGAGTIAVVPQRAWHRFLSLDGFTQIAVTPFPGETIALDVDDPRAVEREPA
jgi:mannose-6-phosphate isomerase-like protein (cupin superfamily)